MSSRVGLPLSNLIVAGALSMILFIILSSREDWRRRFIRFDARRGIGVLTTAVLLSGLTAFTQAEDPTPRSLVSWLAIATIGWVVFLAGAGFLLWYYHKRYGDRLLTYFESGGTDDSLAPDEARRLMAGIVVVAVAAGSAFLVALQALE